MKLHLLDGRKAEGYVTFGSPWKRGKIPDAEALEAVTLHNEQGEEVPMQSSITAYWPDKSIKWVKHTADASLLGKSAELRLDSVRRAYAPSVIEVRQRRGNFQVDTGAIELKIPMAGRGSVLAMDLKIVDHDEKVEAIYPVFQLERHEKAPADYKKKAADVDFPVSRVISGRGHINEVVLEEKGPLRVIFLFKGNYIEEEGVRCKMPFSIRMYLYAGSKEVKFTHTFFNDGNPQKSYLKGMGIQAKVRLSGEPYVRHIRFGTEEDRSFHEEAMTLYSRYPRFDLTAEQCKGSLKQYPSNKDIQEAKENLPIWNNYRLLQDSAYHYRIEKRTGSGCCYITGKEGKRAPGTMSVTGKTGGVMFGMEDFWQKYPGELEAEDLSAKESTCTMWIYSPEAKAYDFRHYDTRSYDKTLYEGFPWVDATPKGIAVTSHLFLKLTEPVVSEEEFQTFTETVKNPPVYVTTPKEYHNAEAFGHWSLVQKNTETQKWLEEQMAKAADFYVSEVENRSWYGLFDYGDVMHTYDAARHTWRYDQGGYAWDNTELVPTYWLWLYFLRTGRSDVYRLAEALTRHTSEVDFYHFGPYKGIGTRHNVRHWGCSCKEPRVSMAGHHRFYYYLSGDERVGDCMRDSRDADKSMKHLKYFKQKSEESGKDELIIRSGPDWTSLLSNWLTEYERTLNTKYLDKAKNGMEDLSKTPFQLASGPDYQLDEKGHLTYLGEKDDAPNTHLQVCQGGTEIWIEAADYLGNEAFKDMLAEYGRFYYLSPAEKKKATGGKIFKRPFSFPYFAAALASYSAARTGDKEFAGRIWAELLHALATEDESSGFETAAYAVCEDGTKRVEIPFITTNFTAQWCLNTIVALEFIGDALPDKMKEVKKLVADVKADNYHKA